VTRVSVCTRRREIVRPRRRLAWVPGSSTLPLAYRSVCHRRCKCSVDFCAACYRSRWLLGNSGCLKRQTPSVDTCRCVPNPEHPRFHLPIGISVACTFCARVFLVAGIDSLAAFAVDPCGRDLGGRPPGSKRCLSPVAFPTRCLEALVVSTVVAVLCIMAAVELLAAFGILRPASGVFFLGLVVLLGVSTALVARFLFARPAD